MPSANVEENINKIEHAIEELTQEVFRLQGSLRVFKGFKEAGLVDVEIPERPQAVEAEAEAEAEPEAEPEAETEESTQE
jgi:hypothetical protein